MLFHLSYFIKKQELPTPQFPTFNIFFWNVREIAKNITHGNCSETSAVYSRQTKIHSLLEMRTILFFIWSKMFKGVESGFLNLISNSWSQLLKALRHDGTKKKDLFEKLFRPLQHWDKHLKNFQLFYAVCIHLVRREMV